MVVLIFVVYKLAWEFVYILLYIAYIIYTGKQNIEMTHMLYCVTMCNRASQSGGSVPRNVSYGAGRV